MDNKLGMSYLSNRWRLLFNLSPGASSIRKSTDGITF